MESEERSELEYADDKNQDSSSDRCTVTCQFIGIDLLTVLRSFSTLRVNPVEMLRLVEGPPSVELAIHPGGPSEMEALGILEEIATDQEEEEVAQMSDILSIRLALD